MKTFMLGWEFPPFISGGLGTACYGLTKAMDQIGVKVTFVLPKAGSAHHASHVKMFGAQQFSESEVMKSLKNVKWRQITSTLRPYVTCETYQSMHAASYYKKLNPCTGQLGCMDQLENYSGDMYQEVHRYAQKAAEIAGIEEFDVIHAHDWMTYPAGIAVATISQKPLLVHVHSTEFDRSGEHINQIIYDIERQGMHAAARVISVSNYTKNIIVNRYGVPSEKVDVVYNGVECDNNHYCRSPQNMPNKIDKIVLFLGRVTMQKGPEYFIAAAKKVLEVEKNVKFVMAGNGDMMYRMVDLVARLGIGHKVLFTGFLRGDNIHKVYQMADLYVMPSVSEPFGITPLEALNHKVPVLISKQSGIAEGLTHALKVDFWDIKEMANKIIAVLKHSALRKVLGDNGHLEAHSFRWEDAAGKISKIYEEALAC